METTIELDRIFDPAMREGVFGLALMCQFMRDPRYAHQYPEAPPEEDLGWDLDVPNSTIHLRYRDPETLQRWAWSSLGEFPRGYAVAPGYTSNEEDMRIYKTGMFHSTYLSNWKPAKKTKARIAMSLDNPKERKRAIADLGAVGIIIDPVEKLGCLTSSDGKVHHININPWGRVRKPKVEETYIGKDGEEKVRKVPGTIVPMTDDGFLFEKTPRTIRPPGSLHPQYIQWVGAKPKADMTPIAGIHEPEIGLLLLRSSLLAYASTCCIDGYVSICLGDRNFKDFFRAFRLYQNKWGLQHVGADHLTTAGVLAKHLDLPENRRYGCYLADPQRKKSVVRFTHKHTPREMPLYRTLLEAMTTSLVEGGNIRSIRKMPMHEVKSKDSTRTLLTYYDLARVNIECNRPWYRSFQYPRQPEKATPVEEGPFSQFINQMEALMGTDVKPLLEIGNRIKNNLFHHFLKRGFDPEKAGSRARERLSKVLFRNGIIQTRRHLTLRLEQAVRESGVSLTEDEIITVLHWETPREAASLLALGSLYRSSKTNGKTERVEDTNDIEMDD